MNAERLRGPFTLFFDPSSKVCRILFAMTPVTDVFQQDTILVLVEDERTGEFKDIEGEDVHLLYSFLDTFCSLDEILPAESNCV